MRTRRAALGTLLTTLLVLVLALPAAAAAGDLDHSFSGDGKLRVGISGGATDVVIQSDGKAVAVGEGGGDFAIVRLNRDGTLDHSFGGDGVVHIAGGPNRFDVANGVVVRNGKITVVGTSTRDSDLVTALALIRLNSDGTPDHSFSGDGLQLLRVGSSSSGQDLAIQGDGRIVAVGTSDHEFLVMRRKPDGSPDPTFSNDGSTRTAFGEHVSGFSVGIDPTGGRIVVGGLERNSGGFEHNFAVAAYTQNGDLDHSFNGNGKMVRVTTVNGGLSALSVLGNGRIVADGTTSQGQAGRQFLLEKYRRDGSFDTSFGGGDGVVVTGFKVGGQARDDAALDLTVQSDGKIVAVGESVGADIRFAVVRLTAGGALDPSFHGGGTLTAFNQDAIAEGVAVNNATHRVLVVGDERTTGPTIRIDAMLAARYLGA
ncbi:MAG: hypothetical protein ACJ77A_07325 [Actinomycetota bacterium]